ncbi:conserved membrane hypothetical protein [anaerobic digester metagenome]|uniref:Membrane protein (DUF2232) n=1 Tax=anaerobic digester metagenome TaxID=1263854 RepID=A0A485LV93_9ZZZZ
MTNSNRAGALSEWGFFTLLIVLAGLAGLYLPFLATLATICLPLPLILLVIRTDIRYGLAGLAAAGLILTVLSSEPVMTLVLIVSYGVLGILYGLLFKNRMSSWKVFVTGIIGSVVLALMSAAVIYLVNGENIFVLNEEARQAALQWLAANQGSMTLNDLPAGWQEEFTNKILDVLELLIPGQYIITTAASAAVTYFLARVALKRFDFPLPPAFELTRIYLPWYSVWGLIAGLGLTLAGDYFGMPLAAKIGKNILFILFYVYLALGLSVGAYFFRKLKVAMLIKLTFLFLAILYIPFSLLVFLLLGVVDTLVNLRRLPEAHKPE